MPSWTACTLPKLLCHIFILAIHGIERGHVHSGNSIVHAGLAPKSSHVAEEPWGLGYACCNPPVTLVSKIEVTRSMGCPIP